MVVKEGGVGEVVETPQGLGVVSRVAPGQIEVETESGTWVSDTSELKVCPYQKLTRPDQAVVDMLSLEFCPEALSLERMNTWAESQVVSEVSPAHVG